MTPPRAPKDGNANPGEVPSAVSLHAPEVSATPPPAPLVILRKRADFLRAARARRQGTPGMMVQGRKRAPDEDQDKAAGIRVGFTCSKKVGNAVARNRAKRRLREVARLILPQHGRAGWDYVLIGRRADTAKRPFTDLQDDLRRALTKIHT